MKKVSRFACAAAFVSLVLALASVAEAATYGCFKVTASSLNIRARPYSSAEIIGTAYKGEILIQRKMFCTPRGFWCAIRRGTLDGYADKSNLEKLAVCPKA